MKNYAIIGASGLIGNHILNELLLQSDVHLTVIGRRSLNLNDHRIKEVVVDFSDASSLISAVKGMDAVFVSVGTTQKKVKGDDKAYRKVDHDVPIAVADACAANSIPKLLLVSSVGADSSSSNFYLRLKGEVEDHIEKLPISFVGIFQPSLLMGNRNEFRLGEKIAQMIMPLISFLLPMHYRPINAQSVAKSMIREAMKNSKGVCRYTYREM